MCFAAFEQNNQSIENSFFFIEPDFEWTRRLDVRTRAAQPSEWLAGQTLRTLALSTRPGTTGRGSFR